jgi:hypothetical protein
LDYIDIHLYAWKDDTEGVDAHLARELRSVEWDKLKTEAHKAGKPIIAGETGVFAHYLRKPPEWTIDHKLGVQCLQEQLTGLKTRGFAGALYWHYGNPDSTPNDEIPALCLFPQYLDVIQNVWITRR